MISGILFVSGENWHKVWEKNGNSEIRCLHIDMVSANVVKIFEGVRISSKFLLSSPLLGESTRIPAHESSIVGGGCKDYIYMLLG
jgi:hypothetical protein